MTHRPANRLGGGPQLHWLRVILQDVVVLHFTTAETLGLEVPPTLLTRAD
jgi:hypothetical protein